MVKLLIKVFFLVVVKKVFVFCLCLLVAKPSGKRARISADKLSHVNCQATVVFSVAALVYETLS